MFLFLFFGAEDEAQTRDPQLGRLMLYQLSYFRNLSVTFSGTPKVATQKRRPLL